MEPYVWRDAEVSFPDFKGTAQLDKKLTGKSGFALAGVDPDKWHVVGLDIGGGEGAHSAHVIAIDMDSVPDDVDNIFDYLLEKHGHVPVTDILLHDVDPYELLKSITHGFELRLRTRNLAGKTLMVTALGDIPKQN